ncbi:NAD(P)H-hydrate dehydratase [Pseudoalteromonas xiamenensis]|uniref:Bifunctional NAD(P)H-hydrate repair enzyme n=1 Tax=Pseudoalteromonas xiamenensis TaxID=882626 RepID=A0A975HLW4_9GAMM|nr:NAD(P)H-hydrate dehydratase [Pseudoalteromonas xiamenensis]QTH72518.1 NAD(P)H-hydrate dehydratase [Pseudoalteromonas xiamenensis]
MKQFSANLPQKAYTAQQVRDNEALAAEQSGTTLSQLMQRAGSAVAAYVQSYCQSQELDGAYTVVLCGKGNNAGDGYIAAKLLKEVGLRVVVWSLFDPSLLKGDAQDAFKAFVDFGGDVTRKCPLDLDEAAITIDAVFGGGFHGQLPEAVQSAFDSIENASTYKVSVDIPSGVNGTTSEVSDNAFQADVTVTFIALKQGMLTGQARGCCGQILFAGLGVAKAFSKLVAGTSSFSSEVQHFRSIPVRAYDSYKHQLGHVLLIGGGKGMAGAIRLAAEACLRSGAGLVSVATHPDNVGAVLQGRYELMVHGVETAPHLHALLEKATIVVLGPGLGLDAWAKELFFACSEVTCPLVIDADGLTLLAQNPQALKATVVTPHLGEAKRLLDKNDVEYVHHRFELAEKVYQTTKAITVLKGPGTIIQGYERRNINRSGTPAMASAGMGDVLSGIIAALLAQQVPTFAAVCLAVYIHGLAAEEAAKDGALGLVASDLFSHIRRILG